jgi:hypothetical protein
VVRVVDVGLGGKPDLEVLEWAAREGRVVVSRDRATLSAEAAQRVSEGRPMPGLILLRWGAGLGRILEDLDRFGAPAPNEPPKSLFAVLDGRTFLERGCS